MEESVNCSKCNTSISNEDLFCSNCGYPERAGKREKDKYEYRIKLKKDVIEDAEKKLKNVKILLFVIAGFNLLMGLYQLIINEAIYDGIAGLIAAGIFIGCAIWVEKQPLTGILAAFIFWILIQSAVVFVDPALLLRGIILKIVIIGIFIKGISSARDYKVYSEQLKEMNVT